MTDRRRERMVRILVVLAGAFFVAAIVGAALLGWGWQEGVWMIPTVAFAVTGSIIVWNLSRHRLGWVLLGFGILTIVNFNGLVLADWVGRLGFEGVAGVLEALAYMLSTVAVAVALPATLMLFPDGEVLSRRAGRWIALPVAAAFLGGGAALFNGGWGGDIDQVTHPNPLRDITAPLGDVLSGIFFPTVMAALFAGVAVFVMRYRQSEDEARHQMKWLLAAAGLLTVVAVTVMALVEGVAVAPDSWEALALAVSFSAIPAAIAVAVLRYRLYDIDIVLSRGLVFVGVAGTITVIYVGIVVGVGTLVGAGVDDLALATTAIALTAITFEPARVRMQRWANRLVYGERAAPYEVLAGLTERLSGVEPADDLLDRMVRLTAEGTSVARATVWRAKSGGLDPAASWPEPPSSSWAAVEDLDGEVFPVDHEGETVGVLQAVMPRGVALSRGERTLLEGLAGSAAMVLGRERLDEELEARAEDLRKSRRRLVEAQDTERRRLERDLHDGAQQHVVSLSVQIGLARHLAAKHGADDVVALLDELAEAAREVVAEIRRVAAGIYPPLLESEGLDRAVRSHVSGLAVPVDLEVGELTRYPKDVESAVYFSLVESTAAASDQSSGGLSVTLTEQGGSLVLAVEAQSDAPSGVWDGEPMQQIHDRVGALGGTVEVDTNGLVIRTPIAAADAAQ